MATFAWDGYARLGAAFARLADPDAQPLMMEWAKIIQDDNRKGVLAGLDKDGNRMKPVTYRPKGAPKRPTKRQKNNVGARGIFAGLGPHAAGLNNDLTSAEYRRLGGPPLAPRGANSRVITNLFLEVGRDPANRHEWFAAGAWAEVVSTRGVPFLPFHFRGAGRLPVRDLAGVRPWGRQRAVAALQRWGSSLLKGIG